MPSKVVIHLFHADESSLGSGAHVAERIGQVKAEPGVALEIYVFGPAEEALADPAQSELRKTLTKLASDHIPVHVCRNTAETLGRVEEFVGLGFTLEYARDAFVRFALEGATVISF
jgi:hypothetical protein